MATKTKDYKVIITDQQNEYTFSAKSKNAIYVKGIKQDDIDTDSFKIVGNNLLFSAKEKDFVVSNYTGIKYIKTDNASGKTDLLDIISHSYVDNTANVISTYNKKLTVTGATNYNDEIDMSSITNLTKTVKLGKKKQIVDKTSQDSGFTIKSGAGDDVVTGSMYSDTITGGIGKNIINYTKGHGNDTIVLTKNEDLTLNIKGLSRDDLSFNVIKKNLIISYTDDNNETQKLTLKNFGTKDVVGGDGKVTLCFDNGDDINLKTDLYLDEIKVIKNYTGTYHSEEINAEDYQLYKIVKVGKTKVKEENNEVSSKGLTIKSGAGNDVITGSKYSDKIYGNTGTDTINAGTGNNYIYFNKGDGNDIVENGNGIDTLVFAKKTQLSYSYDKYDLILKYSDKDTVTLKDYLKGHSVKFVQIGKNRTLFNPEKPKFNEYDEGEYHVIEGTAIEDTIVGTNNNDKIFGNDGDDNIDARKGADIIDGGTGNNTYTFVSGDGQDTIINGNGNDTIEFPDTQNITYSKMLNSNDLIIGYGDSDSITLRDYFVDNSHSTKTILNGTTELNISEEVAKGYNLFGTESAETFDGTTDIPFTYVVNGGNDIIQNSKNTDTIKINTQETLSYSKASNSNDLVITYGNNSITVKDYFDTENHVEKIVNKTNILNIANELDNKLEILIPDNETNITGTTNDDVIHLKDTGVTLFVSEGDGKDIIYSGTDEDTLVINNKTFDDISYVKTGNDLVINYSDNDSVTLKNYFTEEHSVKNITAGDDTELLADKIKLYFNGTNNSETITGTDYDDVITSNKGNDTIDGGKKNNTYIFISGDGKDTIVNGQGNDSIKFNTNLDLRFSHNLQNNDLVIAYSNSDTITLQNYYVNNSHSVKTIINGTESLTVEEALNIYGIDITGTSNSENITGTSANDTIIGGRGADIIDGGSGNNIYVFNTGDGTDTIINGTGVDTIKFNITQTLTYTHDLANDDLVIGYGNSDSIVLKDYFKTNSHSVDTIINNTQSLDLITELSKGMTIIGTSSDESIDGTIGDDIIRSNGGVDIITGGKGTDKLYGGSGNSTYVFSIGNGKDEIYSGTGQDTIVINNVTFDDLIYEKSNNDLIINYSNEDSITLKNYFITTHSVKNITVAGDTELLTGKIKLSFNGTDSSETITGTDYDDTITANQGNDTINGGLGNNLYVFNQNDGRDTIIKGNGTDTIKFNQTGNIRFSRDFSNSDLVLKYGNNDTITLQNYYVNNSHSVKTIINGTETLTLEEALNAYGIDITGTSGNNNITGTSANDTINAGQGSDTIDGGSGNNTYLFTSGDGTDTIINGTGVDTIKFNTAQTLTYTKDIPNNNLIISYGNNDTITLQNYFVGDNHSVKTIQNGTQTLTIADEILKGMTFIGSSSADTINGTDYSDVIRSIAGNDTITANKGNDELYSGSGNSTYVFNLGNEADNIYSGSGEDTIEINGVTFDNLSYTKDNNNLIINYSNSDSIKLIDFFSSTHSVKNIKIGDTIDLLDNRIKDLVINGTNNAETVNGTKYDDIITPNGGNDTINGGLGNNTYVFKIGDGTNSIVKGTGTDKVILPNNSTIKLSRNMSNQDLTINYGTNSNVVLKDYFVNSNHSVKSIVINDTEKTLANFIAENGIEYTGTNSGETINGSSGNDTITGGKGNDTLNGSAGNDFYVFASGDGTDTINATVGEDTIWFKTQVSNIGYTKSSNNQDLILTYGNNDSITIKGYFTGTSSIRNIKNGNTISTIENSIEQLGYTMIGTDSNDTITGSNIKDVIDGRKGSDTIHGGAGDDTIYGGSNDTGTVYGVPGDDTIYGEEGNDYIETSKGYTYKDTFGKTQTLYSNNYVDGGSGNDTIICYNGNNTVVGGIGNDKITVGNGINTLNFASGDGNDTIYVGSLSDTIKFSNYELDNLKYEKSENNLIIKYGNNYSDSITLDKFFNTTNNNRNLIGKNNTNSTIQDNAQIYTTPSTGGTYLNDIYTLTETDLTPNITSTGGNDTLYFASTIMDDLVYKVTGNDLYVGFNKVDGSVRNWAILKNYMTNSNHSVKYIKTSDSKTINIEDVILTQGFSTSNNVITGTRLSDSITASSSITTINGGAGNDIIIGSDGGSSITINGGIGSDTLTSGTTPVIYTFNSGDGNDIIYNCKATDTLKFNINNLDSLTWSKLNDDLIINYSDNGTITLKDYFYTVYNITLKTSTKSKMLLDIIQPSVTASPSGYGTYYSNSPSNHTFIKIVTCKEYKDKYGFGTGKYYDYKTEYRIDDKTVASIPTQIETPGSRYTYGWRRDSGTQFYDLPTMQMYEYEYDDIYLFGTKYMDIIHGKDYRGYTIRARGGDDLLYGGYNSANAFQFYAGDGNDTLYSANSSDRLKFLIDDLTYEKLGNDLLIRYNSEKDSLLIKDHFINTSPVSVSIDNLKINGKIDEANNITGTSYSDIIQGGNQDDIIDGQDGDDTIYGGNGNDTIQGWSGNDTIHGGDGDDIIYGASGKDIIYGEGGADNIEGGSGNDTIYGGEGNDTLRGLAGDDTIYGGIGNDYITGGNDNDTIYGEEGDDQIAGNGGNDTLDGGLGTNTFLYGNESSGNDTIVNGSGNDTIKFSTTTELSYSRKINSNDLIITHNNGTIALKDFFVNNSHSVKTINNAGTILNLIEQLNTVGININGTSSDDNITGTAFIDIIRSGAGADTINGDDGDDDIEGSNGNDTIYGGNGHDVLRGLGDDDIIYGEVGNDYITGGNGNDTIYGGIGDDYMEGNAGSNLLYGGTGNDIYAPYKLEDFDTIYDESGKNDSIKIRRSNKGDVVIRLDVKVDADGNIIEDSSKDIYITKTADFGNSTIGVKVIDQFVSGHSIERITTADGYYLTTTQLIKLRDDIAAWLHNGGFESVQQILDSGNETNINNLIAEFQKAAWQQNIINGELNESNNITGTDYADIIHGGDQNDYLNGWSGSDILYGGAGNDELWGASENDTLYGEDGDDYLVGGTSNDLLYGGTGNDTYMQADLIYYDEIFDESGSNDNVEIRVNKDNFVLCFDIRLDEDGNIIEDSCKDMYITNTADFGNTTIGVKVIDQFVEGHSIESIKTKDNYVLSATQINQLRSDVAGWIYNQGFESVQQILDSNNQTNINNLIAEFQKANWQQA